MTKTNRFIQIGYKVLVIILLSGCSINSNEFKSECINGVSVVNKVLFIGIDGCRTDALVTANSPEINSLMAHAFVNLHCDRGPFTVSEPGWSTILHGVNPAKHGVTSVSFKSNNYDKYPDLFYYLRKSNPNFSLAEVSNWDRFLPITSNENFAQAVSTDAEVKEKGLFLLKSCTPDVLLLHFDHVDHVGHQSGFTPTNIDYLQAIRQTGKYISELMSVIEQREKNYSEKWLVIVATDHGGSGTEHGGQDELQNTRYVFQIARLPNQIRVNLPLARNIDIMPTILKYMSVKTESVWDLDGVALF
jgi:predicted AlkP superfamily pyrophosphatase or phosphodiesterase